MKLYERLMNTLGICAAALVAVMTLMVTCDVLMRNSGLGSLDWVLEVTEYMLPTIISFTAPWLMYRNQHVRLDLLQAVLNPASMRVLERCSAGVGVVAAMFFSWFAWKLLLDSKESGALVFKSLIFPEWWLYVATPIGFLLLGIECARRAFLPTTVNDEDRPAGAL